MKDFYVYNNNNFYIKKNSTLPILKIQLLQSILEEYDITEDMLENVGVTFSMTNVESGVYHIANKPATLLINKDRKTNPDEVEYTLSYKFTLKDTKRVGNFEGEFKIDFLGDNCGKITIPNDSKIKIYIQDSITKTTVI